MMIAGSYWALISWASILYQLPLNTLKVDAVSIYFLKMKKPVRFSDVKYSWPSQPILKGYTTRKCNSKAQSMSNWTQTTKTENPSSTTYELLDLRRPVKSFSASVPLSVKWDHHRDWCIQLVEGLNETPGRVSEIHIEWRLITHATQILSFPSQFYIINWLLF